MTDLLTRLQRLSGDNPVAYVKLLPEDWPEIAGIIEDAERYQYLVAMLPVGTFADHDVFNKESWDAAIDSARTTTKETKCQTSNS